MGWKTAPRSAAGSVGRGLLSACVSATMAFSSVEFLPRPAMAQADDSNFDWGSYCNTLFDKQIAAGRATEGQRSAYQSMCMAVDMLCIGKYGAFYSLDPAGMKRKMDECFVEGMKPAVGQSRSPRRTRSTRQANASDEGAVGQCTLAEVAVHPALGQKYCTDAIATASSRHDKALAYAYRGEAEEILDNRDTSGTALADGTRALMFDFNLAEGAFVKGEVYANTFRVQDAVIYLDRAIQLGLPPLLLQVAYSLRGIMHETMRIERKSQDEARLAIADFSRSLALQKNPQDYRFRANAEEYLGQADAAQADRKAATEIDGKTE